MALVKIEGHLKGSDSVAMETDFLDKEEDDKELEKLTFLERLKKKYSCCLINWIILCFRKSMYHFLFNF